MSLTFGVTFPQMTTASRVVRHVLESVCTPDTFHTFDFLSIEEMLTQNFEDPAI